MNDELVTIQRLIDKEHHFTQGKWLPANFQDHVQPLVITLENYLKEEGFIDASNRRTARLEILRRITRQNLTSANNLSAYQCQTIYGFLIDKESDDYRTTEHGTRLLQSITDDFENYGVHKEEHPE